MCMFCIEIQKGKFKSVREFEQAYNIADIDIDLDHYFEELGPLLESLGNNKNSLVPINCSCGAKYTSRPNYHLKYCK